MNDEFNIKYCRYCSHCSYGDVVYCSITQKTMSEKKATLPTKCKHFDFCEIDVFNPDKIYKKRERKNYKQLNIYGEER